MDARDKSVHRTKEGKKNGWYNVEASNAKMPNAYFKRFKKFLHSLQSTCVQRLHHSTTSATQMHYVGQSQSSIYETSE